MATINRHIYKASPGVIYTRVFKFVTLLLFSLLLEKCAEGIIQRGGVDLPLRDITVGLPIWLGQSFVNFTGQPHWKYICGFFQLAVTVLFAAKYFLCLIDPIERIAKVDSVAVKWITYPDLLSGLSPIRGWHIFMVTLISIPEFVIVFHACVSFCSIKQWIIFLILLVLWDSIAFFVLLPSLILFIKLHIIYLEKSWQFTTAFIILKNSISIIKFLIIELMHKEKAKKLQDKIRSLKQIAALKERLMKAKRKRDLVAINHIKSAISVYVWWNVGDFISLVSGMALYIIISQNGQSDFIEFLTAMWIFLFSIFLARLNWKYNKGTWRRHLQLLFGSTDES
ncbi:MAG: hypothetical protein R3F48_05600 [Candidatus Zixiibacteriota bacterium]